MIFYTLHGPSSKLEIYEDKIRVIKKGWLSLFASKDDREFWKICDLSQFEITVPKFLFFSGKIEWQSFSGVKGSFRFNTNPAMVKKIETYLQKRVVKNHQRIMSIPSSAPKVNQNNDDQLAA